MTIEPPGEDPAWYASISLLDTGTYEVELNDPRRRDHRLTTETDPSQIANQMIRWLTHRSDNPDHWADI